jgi:hypothetical protein
LNRKSFIGINVPQLIAALALLAGPEVHAQTAATVPGVFPNTNMVYSFPALGFAQGTCNDGVNPFWFGTTGIRRLHPDYSIRNEGPALYRADITNGLDGFGTLHLGDPDYYQGYIYTPMEAAVGAPKGSVNVDVTLFVATNLAHRIAISVSNYQSEISAVCIDPVLSNSVALFACNWASTSPNDGIYEYRVNNLTNLTFVRVLPLTQYIRYLQGIICIGGMLYVIGDNGPSGELYQVNPTNGVVVHLAQLNLDGEKEWEGLDYYQGFLVANEGQTGTADLFDFFGVLSGTNQTISGSVTDGNQHPIAGVGVSATASINFTNQHTGMVDTDTNGNYSLSVPNGNWTVRVNLGNGSDSLHSLGYSNCPASQSIFVAGNDATANFIVQNCTGLSIITPSQLPAGGAGLQYQQALQAAGCNPGFSWLQTDGALPPGLSVSTNGILSGTPAGPADSFTFTVQATDANGATTNQTFTLAITNVVNTITGSVKDNHNAPIAGVGVVAAFLNGTNLQAVTIDTDTNGNYALLVTGIVATVGLNCGVGSDGLSHFGDYVCPDSQYVNLAWSSSTNNFVVQSCQLIINTPPALPLGEAGVFYSQLLQASSCSQSFTWTNTDGFLPPGLTLSGDGTLSGVPAGPGGSFNFIAQATDTNNSTASRSFSIDISNAVHITTASLPDGFSCNTLLSASDGVPPYAWSLSPGSSSLPPNLTLTADGLLLGLGATNGSFSFSVRVTDNLAGIADQLLTINFYQALTISATGGQINIFWPESATNYVLESTTDLASPDWEIVTNALPGTVIAINNPAPVMFFRLQQTAASSALPPVIVNEWKGSATWSTIEISVNPAAGDLLALFVGGGDGSTITVSDSSASGMNWTLVGSTNGGAAGGLYCYFLTNTPGSAFVITNTFSGNFATCIIEEVAGCSKTAPLADWLATGSNMVTDNPQTGTITSVANSISFAAACSEQANGDPYQMLTDSAGTIGTWSLHDSMTSQELNGNANAVMSVPNFITTNTVSEAHGWLAGSSCLWAEIIVNFKP